MIAYIEREARATGNKRVLTAALGEMGRHRQEDGLLAESFEALREAYELAQATGERLEVPDMLSRMASTLVAAGEHVRATRVLAKATDVHSVTGGGERSWVAERDAATLAAVKANLDGTEFERAWNEGLALTDYDAGALAR